MFFDRTYSTGEALSWFLARHEQQSCFPGIATPPSLILSGNHARSAIKPSIRLRAFILNVRSSELLLWNQGARGQRHPRLVPHSQSSYFGLTPPPKREPDGS